MVLINLEEVTVALLRRYSAVWAVAPNGESLEVRPSRIMLPFVSSQVAGSIMPPPLEVMVLSLDEAGLAPLRQHLARLEEEMRGAEGQ